MDKFATNMAEMLSEYNIISIEEAEICRYGIILFLTSVLEISAILLLSLFVGNFAETVVFLVAFLPIRIYAGGYHADTKLRCFLIFVGMYAIFSLLLGTEMETMKIYQNSMPIISALAVAVIYVWSPLQNKNKTLTDNELKKFKSIALILSVAEGIIIILLEALNIYNKFSTALSIGLFSVITSLVAGKIKENLKGGK